MDASSIFDLLPYTRESVPEEAWQISQADKPVVQSGPDPYTAVISLSLRSDQSMPSPIPCSAFFAHYCTKL